MSDIVPIGARPARVPAASLGQRALAGEAATAVDPQLDAAITEALERAREFDRLWADCGRRVSLSEEAEVLGKVPAVAMLEKLAADLEAVVYRPPDDRVNRILVGLLVDSFPQNRAAQPGTYQDALASDLLAEGFPPVAVAEGLRELRRTKTFLPSIAEALEAVRGALGGRKSRASILRMFAKRRAGWTASLNARTARATGTPPQLSPAAEAAHIEG